MQIGFIGLGRMGGNMVHRIHRDSDHEVVAFDFSAEAVATAEGHGATGAGSLEELVGKLSAPGSVWGLSEGYCMMVGGPDEGVQRLAPILDVLAPPDGWRHFGDVGGGHFVKMVHNGVEYGMMQAYAEGFEL